MVYLRNNFAFPFSVITAARLERPTHEVIMERRNHFLYFYVTSSGLSENGY